MIVYKMKKTIDSLEEYFLNKFKEMGIDVSPPKKQKKRKTKSK